LFVCQSFAKNFGLYGKQSHQLWLIEKKKKKGFDDRISDNDDFIFIFY
jgi:aspartate/tyrosine/aromatic aminotransferase